MRTVSGECDWELSKKALKASVTANSAMSVEDTSSARAARSTPARGTGRDHAVT